VGIQVSTKYFSFNYGLHWVDHLADNQLSVLSHMVDDHVKWSMMAEQLVQKMNQSISYLHESCFQTKRTGTKETEEEQCTLWGKGAKSLGVQSHNGLGK